MCQWVFSTNQLLVEVHTVKSHYDGPHIQRMLDFSEVPISGNVLHAIMSNSRYDGLSLDNPQ